MGLAYRLARPHDVGNSGRFGRVDFLRANFARVETRLGELTTRIAIERDLAGVKADYAATQLRLDSIDQRIERKEWRPSLIDGWLARGRGVF